MNGRANVTSIDSVKQFGVAVSAFVEESRDALAMADLSMRRVVDWIEHEQRSYWRNQLRRRQQGVEQARLALEQRRLSGTRDHRPDCIEQQKALRAARQRLEEAEAKMARVRHWSRAARRAVEEYRGQVQSFVGLIDGDPPRVLSALDGIGSALDSYLAVAPPATRSRSADVRASVRGGESDSRVEALHKRRTGEHESA